MQIIKGKAADIIVYQDTIDDATRNQISLLADQDFLKDNHVRIMPDCHAGAGCVIGTTMLVKDKVVPNLVGVDIGCGMLLCNLGKISIDFAALDAYIHAFVPSGMNVNSVEMPCDVDFTAMRCYSNLKNRAIFGKAVGSLGGGNHFIEIDSDSDGCMYLVIHTGSRNLGKQVAEAYQKRAICQQSEKLSNPEKDIAEMIAKMKAEGKSKDIQTALKSFRAKKAELPFPEELAYVEGDALHDYLFDMDIAQKYATCNRETIARRVLKFLHIDFDSCEHFETVHNYINMEDHILRKGSIAAYAGTEVIIPINMRDGTIIAKGKSNPEYNYSAPHGAGRAHSRSEAKKQFTVDQFKESMKGIYTSCVEFATLDESPFAYKPLEMILPNIKDTVDVEKIIKPAYNFKAVEDTEPSWMHGVIGK
jgi:tRNA-splicing ligase RtcB